MLAFDLFLFFFCYFWSEAIYFFLIGLKAWKRQGVCSWDVPCVISSFQSFLSFQLKPSVRQNKDNKERSLPSESSLSAERRMGSCGGVEVFWTAWWVSRQGTAAPTLIKWDWNGNTVETNNKIIEITHLTGFDWSLTFRGRMDHVDSCNSPSDLFRFSYFHHILFCKTISKASGSMGPTANSHSRNLIGWNPAWILTCQLNCRNSGNTIRNQWMPRPFWET